VYNESVGNFKLVKLGTREKAMTTRFDAVTYRYGLAQVLYATLQAVPRFILETVGFLILVSIILYVIYRHNNAAFVVPIVSLYALAFYRLLPSLNKILSSFNQLVFAQHGAYGIYEFLQYPIETVGFQSLPFDHTISVHNISFGYLPQKNVLHQAFLSINKGERVALVGPSGAGKSTMADLIMGLYHPSQGQVMIDDQVLTESNQGSWRRKIGYIPQSIYLFDATVADNVVFGRAYDQQKLERCLQQAHIYDFLMDQQGFETKVGEGGIKLSGGQKQRIAIARALYSQPVLLILDEATSALDHEVESAVMNEIYQLDRGITMIVIAHRLTTVARCDKIYKIDQGSVCLVTFEQIAKSSYTAPQQPQA
jgi:ATP-binding cassette subfamily B protein/ATP-binding cassette subfamily C protein